MTKKRLLFIHQFGGRGGASTMLANILADIDKDACEVMVLTPAGDAVRQFEAAGARVTLAPRAIHQFFHTSGSSKPIFHPLFLANLYRIARDRKFWRDYIRGTKADLVHLDAVTLAPLALSVERAERKVVCLVQETAVRGWLGLRTRWLSRLLRERVNASVFISEYDRVAFGCGGVPAEVIPNWVDLRAFDRSRSKAESRRQLGLAPDAKVVLFMGGIQEIKGTVPLLKACAGLSDIEGLSVVIAGYNRPVDVSELSLLHRAIHWSRVVTGRTYHAHATSLLEIESLKSRVKLMGLVEDVVPLYAAADVVVFPATSPHQARPVLEAGAMGRPVVVSDFENVKEFVVNGVTALTVPPGDSFSLAQAIRRVLLDPALANRLGEGNYLMTKEKHNREINARKFAALYDRLLALPAAQGAQMRVA